MVGSQRGLLADCVRTRIASKPTPTLADRFGSYRPMSGTIGRPADAQMRTLGVAR
jgi:hypothetical protein